MSIIIDVVYKSPTSWYYTLANGLVFLWYHVGQCSKACSGLEEVLPDLLELSVLVPAAPWVSDEATYF